MTMKKILTLFIALGLIFHLNATAQEAVVSIGNYGKTETGPVEIPVDVNFDLGKTVGSFILTINFDPAVLTYNGFVNPGLDGIVETVSYGSVRLFWIDFNFEGTNLNGKLLDLDFEYLGGGSNIAFAPEAPGVTEISDLVGNVLVAEFNSGSIYAPPPVPLKNWAIVTGLLLMLGFVVFRLKRFF